MTRPLRLSSPSRRANLLALIFGAIGTALVLVPSLAKAQIAGPDSYGYTVDAAVYDWVDISALGTSIAINSDDAEANITLPFSFPFYSGSYTTLRVADNGGIYTASTGSLTYVNGSLPRTSGADILPFWDDLRAYEGDIRGYHDTTNGRYIISFINAGYWSSSVSGTISFQVHLYPSGELEFHYQDTFFATGATPNYGASATAGIQEFTGTSGSPVNAVQLSNNATTYLQANTAYVFEPPNLCDDIDLDGFEDISCGGTDCDDSENTVYPGAPEICGDSIDQDCDGADASGDADMDGWDVCTDCDDTDPAVDPGVNVDGDIAHACIDCDDSDPLSYPGALETCDGVDNDCDGVLGGSSTYTSVTETNSSSGTGYFRGGKFEATASTVIDEVGVELTIGAGETVTVGVYEATSELGSYTLAGSASITTTSAGQLWRIASGLNVPVTAGNFYVVGAVWTGSATFHYASSGNSSFPYPTGWGDHIGGASSNSTGSSLPGTFSWSTSGTSYNVQVTTVGGVDEDDTDLDGVLACNGDCDDTQPTVYPGANEACDGLDSNCDGTIPATEFDGDSDGWIGCLDCDDTDVTVFPGATELCDGLDNDCDGNGDGADVDLDGFFACNDCDDNDPLSYPGATELCDGFDNDCDGSPGTGGATVSDTYEWFTTSTSTSGTSRFRGDRYLPSQDVTLTGIEMYIGGSYTGVNFQVWESTTGTSGWTRIASSPYASTTGSSWRASGTMNVTLEAGKYYVIGAMWSSSYNVTYYYGTLPSTSNPAWGDHTHGITGNYTASTTGATFSTSSSGYSQRLHTTTGGGNDEVDSDGDGALACADCDDNDATLVPGGPELCNGLDDNCDLSVPADEFDQDGDGQAECEGDCDETSNVVYLGAPELCDGLDNDCNSAVPSTENDGDLDGFLACEECDDTEITVYPGASELCDGLDNDCNGVVPPTEIDNDSDGFDECGGLDCDDGDITIFPGATEICDGLDGDCDGVVPANEADDDFDNQMICEGDCDDTNPTIYVGAPELCDALDNDCDTVVPGTEIDNDLDGVPTCANDCDDNDPLTYPGATEQCDGIDNDCNGIVPGTENDADSDGWRICDADCNDNDPTINPVATELCDGIDNDCNGLPDADPAGEVDADGDGSRSCEDCDDFEATAFPGNNELCDGIDNDCQNGPDYDTEGEVDLDEDGWLSCEECDDDNRETYPGATEVCDGEDNNCDGDLPDEEWDEDEDGMSPCQGDCDDEDPNTYDGAPEICDELDNDCDGTFEDEADDLDEDGITPCDGDCDDTEADTNPTADEICDGEDNDCDEVIPDDELDLDEDGFAECDGDCDDEEATAYPGAFEDTEELCNDGIDNDCDGDRDRQEEDCDGLWIAGDDDDDDGGGRSTACACDAAADGSSPTLWALLGMLAVFGGRARRRS